MLLDCIRVYSRINWKQTNLRTLHILLHVFELSLKPTVMQIEKALINDHLPV